MNELAPDARFVPGMLSVRACNVIDNTLPYVNAPHGEVHLNLNAATLADLARMSVLDLRRAKGCGPKIRAEIRRLLQRAGLDLQHVGTPTVNELFDRAVATQHAADAAREALRSHGDAFRCDRLEDHRGVSWGVAGVGREREVYVFDEDPRPVAFAGADLTVLDEVTTAPREHEYDTDLLVFSTKLRDDARATTLMAEREAEFTRRRGEAHR